MGCGPAFPQQLKPMTGNKKDPTYYPEDEPTPKDTDEGSDDGGSGMEEGGVQTALLPKSLFDGYECNPGDRIEMEVVHSYEDEKEVKFVKKLKGGKGDSEESGMDMRPEDQMDAMATDMTSAGV